MGENRSFDNLLGYLYTRGDLPEGQDFEGLDFGQYYNELDGVRYDAHIYEGPTDAIMTYPDPDPGEMYPHVNTQLYNVIDPAENADAVRRRLPARRTTHPEDGQQPTMSGFVTDYIR